MAKTERIALGSGRIYMMEFSGNIPADTAIETDANNAGYIKGGASIEYTPEFYEVKDDLEIVVKRILTSEEALLKTGFLTWNGETLKRLCSTARVENDETNKKRIVKIGGYQNYRFDKYLIRFVHKDKLDGDCRLTIVGNNQSGLTIAFAKDAETVIDAEFKALPCDDEGTLIIYEEEIKTVPSGD